MNSVQKKRILVLDADMVPALTISRSLSRRGCLVDTASHIDKPITGYSNRVGQVYIYPDPLSAEGDFLQWLDAHTKSEKYDLVIPVTERSLVPISKHRDLFGHVNVAMSSAASLELVLDKEQTILLAERVDVPVPRGVSISSMDDLSHHLPEMQYPVVIKPARSIGISESGSSQLKVNYAYDENGLRAGCEHGLRFGPILLQQYFRGRGVGIELISQQGKIIYAFQHLRLHEVPLTGGGSSLRKSEPIEQKLLEASERLITALEWNGVAMVEFKWDPETRDFCLMEINGRFWGSLPLASAAGADFPSMLLDLELAGEVFPCKPYKPQIYCRKLSSDLFWYEAVLRRGQQPEIADIPSGWAVFRELALFMSPRHRFDVQSLRDPIPGLVDIGIIITSYIHRIATMLGEKSFLWRQKRAWRRGDVARSITSASSILFMCYGNINRSALADVLLRSYAEDSGLSVTSAGFHEEVGRPADPAMIDVANTYGIDLNSSRSTIVSGELLRSSDVIFVMEKSHADTLLSLDEACLNKVWLLGAHWGNSGFGPEIEDPNGRSREGYEFCYRRISEGIDHIKSILTYRRSE